MNRESVKKAFESMGSRVTIRTGIPSRLLGGNINIRVNVAKDSKGEHFTITISPELDEKKIEIVPLDVDKKHRQMLLMVSYFTVPDPLVTKGQRSKSQKIIEKLLVGHDEMHWFVAGVSESKNIREAFENLRPKSVTKVKFKDMYKRKTKGLIRQGEWFFVPTVVDEKDMIIHKNEPINRVGGSSHIVSELIRSGGQTIYVMGSSILSIPQYKHLQKKDPESAKFYKIRTMGARVFGRGKVRHKDHHTIVLKGWHEILLSNEKGTGTNAFID